MPQPFVTTDDDSEWAFVPLQDAPTEALARAAVMNTAEGDEWEFCAACLPTGKLRWYRDPDFTEEGDGGYYEPGDVIAVICDGDNPRRNQRWWAFDLTGCVGHDAKEANHG